MTRSPLPNRLDVAMDQLALHESSGTTQLPTFLSLPFEIRTRIYALVMRADCGLQGQPDVACNKPHQHPEDFDNAISLMYTCKQIYVETFEIVRRAEVKLTLDGRGPSALRDPREFGKPGYFDDGRYDCWQVYKADIPLLFEPLQIASLRKVHLEIVLPLGGPSLTVEEGGGFNLYNSLVSEHVNEVAEALGKSWTMQQVRLTLIGTSIIDDEDAVSNSFGPRLQLILRPIIAAAARAGFSLLLDECSDVVSFMFRWLYDAARANGVEVSKHVECDRESLEKGESSGEPPEMLQEDLKVPSNPRSFTPLRLQVQCRHCCELFRHKSELKEHLKADPKHRIKFKAKHWNKLATKAVRHSPARFRCYACALPCEYRAALNDHIARTRHRRPGIMPKYREDNWKMDDIYAGPRRGWR